MIVSMAYFWFMMYQLLIFMLLAVFPAYSFQNKEAATEQTDQKIQELEDVKRGFEAKAIYHEDQADRLQFDDHTYLEMRRHRQIADENRAKAAAVQKEIDRLRKTSPHRE